MGIKSAMALSVTSCHTMASVAGMVHMLKAAWPGHVQSMAGVKASAGLALPDMPLAATVSPQPSQASLQQQSPACSAASGSTACQPVTM